MKVNTRKTLTYLSLFVFTLPVLESQAEIFKCTSNDKSIYYNDKPCPVLDTEKKMNHVKDIDKGYVPNLILSEEYAEKTKKQLSKGNSDIVVNPHSEKAPQTSPNKQRDNLLSNDSGSDIKKNVFEDNSPFENSIGSQDIPLTPSQNGIPPESTQTIKEANVNQLRHIKTY